MIIAEYLLNHFRGVGYERISRFAIGFVLHFFYAQVACSSDNATRLPSGYETEPPSQSPLKPNLASIQLNIFGAKCAVSGCHVLGGSGPMPFRNADQSFDNLVNVRSVQKPALFRVAHNDVDNSYLVRKIEGAGIIGGRMPLFRPALSSEGITAIRGWIEQGAQESQGD